ncbi:MAG: hypothetical protein ACU85E_05860 [Gammaproteobacteria bacterium]
MDLKQELDKFADGLEQLRDEVKVQLHLASLESKQEWDKAERLWDQFRAQFDQVANETKGNTDDMVKKAKIVGEELKSTYQRIKDRMSD